MAKIVKSQCPECGARLQLDAESAQAKCEYCGAVSRIERQKPPKDPNALRQQGPVIYVPKASNAWTDAAPEATSIRA